MNERRPAEVFHPGEHLEDELSARGWTQTEFAEIINRPVRLVNEIINGKRGITPETAREFGAALSTSPEFWMNLDTAYSLWKTQTQGEDVSPIEHRAKMRSVYPVRDMVLRGWLRMSEDTKVVESQLLRFFGIKSLDEQPKLVTLAAAKRSNIEVEDFTPTQRAWLYRVAHIAAGMPVSQYSKKSLKDAVTWMMSIRDTPEEIRQIPKLLANCGVRFVIVEPLASSKIDGVTFWLDNHSPVIGLSLRFDRIDNFWFVLRHEIEHVLNEDGKGSVIIDTDMEVPPKDGDKLSEEEKIANAAAAEFCTPQKDLKNFIARVGPIPPRIRVSGFALKHKLHPGLVVGQIQRHLNRFDLFRQMLVPIRYIITPVAMTDGFGYVLPVEI